MLWYCLRWFIRDESTRPPLNLTRQNSHKSRWVGKGLDEVGTTRIFVVFSVEPVLFGTLKLLLLEPVYLFVFVSSSISLFSSSKQIISGDGDFFKRCSYDVRISFCFFIISDFIVLLLRMTGSGGRGIRVLVDWSLFLKKVNKVRIKIFKT
jgi:hypothetical protein